MNKILIVVIIILAVGGYLFFSQSKNPTGDMQKQLSNSQPIVNEETDHGKVVPYSDASVSFEYPSVLHLETKGADITLTHSIPYKHPNPCDFKGDAPPLDRLIDFNTSIKIVHQSVKDYIQSSGWPTWDYVSKNPYSHGSFTGYRVTTGVEGCGQDLYYLTISPNKTLVIVRPFVAEFASVNADYQKYLDLPGVIVPDKATEYFSKLLSSLVIK